MKHSFLILSLFIAFCCHLNAAPLTAPADTLNDYYIDGIHVAHFDGSQLVGKTIASYQILSHTTSTGVVLRAHDIRTERHEPIRPDPAYVIDGVQVTAEQFGTLRPSDILNMTILKNDAGEDIKQYVGWENGVILVETKTGSARDED